MTLARARAAEMGELLDGLVDALADRIAERIQARLGQRPRYYDAADNPLGSKRSFLDAARRGEFPSFRRGKRVLARREDVDAWLEAGERRSPVRTGGAEAPRELTQRDRDLQLLRQAGLRRIGGERKGKP